jgi:hypothetical protein
MSGAGSLELEQITVEVPDTEHGLRDAYAAIFSRQFVRVLPYYIWAVSLHAFVVFLALLSPKRLFAILNFEILGLIILILSFSLLWVPGWRARLDARNSLLVGVPAVWRFTAKRVSCSLGERSSFDADLGVLYGVEKLPHGLLVLTHRLVVHWIPRSAFASERDFDQVAEWAAFGAPRYRERLKWKFAEWLAALLIAPSAIPLALYFAYLAQSGVNVLDSYPTLATIFGLSLPHCYALSWFVAAPIYGFLSRYTRRLPWFLLAGAALGALQTVGFMREIVPYQPGLAAWIAGFSTGALIHWLIVVRESRA